MALWQAHAYSQLSIPPHHLPSATLSDSHVALWQAHAYSQLSIPPHHHQTDGPVQGYNIHSKKLSSKAVNLYLVHILLVNWLDKKDCVRVQKHHCNVSVLLQQQQQQVAEQVKCPSQKVSWVATVLQQGTSLYWNYSCFLCSVSSFDGLYYLVWFTP